MFYFFVPFIERIIPYYSHLWCLFWLNKQKLETNQAKTLRKLRTLNSYPPLAFSVSFSFTLSYRAAQVNMWQMFFFL